MVFACTLPACCCLSRARERESIAENQGSHSRVKGRAARIPRIRVLKDIPTC